MIAFGYILLFTPFYTFGLLILFGLILYHYFLQKMTVYSLFRKFFLIYVLILLSIATILNNFYNEINNAIVSLGYTSDITYLFLPNLSSTGFLRLFPKELRILIIFFINLFLFSAIIFVFYPNRFISIRKVKWTIDAVKISIKREFMQILTTYLLVFSSICLVALTIIKLTSGLVLPSYITFLLKVVYYLRNTTVIIPYIVLPLLVLKPNIFRMFHQFLDETILSWKSTKLKLYHFVIILIISWFFYLNFAVTPVDNPNLCMFDDRLYHHIWVYMREGVNFYEAWKVFFPSNTEAYMHWSLLFYLWAVCKTVPCVKVEYFLLSTVAVVSSFYLTKKLTENSFIGVLSMLYIMCFYSRGFFWFMLDQWAAVPLLIGLMFLAYGKHSLSATFFVLAFFFKETTVIPLFVATLLYSIPSVKRIALGDRSRESLERTSYLIGFLLILVFMMIHSATYTGSEYAQKFLKIFAPHYFVHQLSWFMYPVGIINFSLAITGVFLIKDDNRKKLFLILAIISTHLLFFAYNKPSEGSARNCVAAIVIEYILAPIGLKITEERVAELVLGNSQIKVAKR